MTSTVDAARAFYWHYRKHLILETMRASKQPQSSAAVLLEKEKPVEH
jgi:hypothetical protein